MTPAGYDRLFSAATYSFKFRFVQVVLRHGVKVTAAARRLNALVHSVKGAAGITLGPTNSTPTVIQAIRGVSVLPFALGGFLVLLAVVAVGRAGHAAGLPPAAGTRRDRARRPAGPADGEPAGRLAGPPRRPAAQRADPARRVSGPA